MFLFNSKQMLVWNVISQVNLLIIETYKVFHTWLGMFTVGVNDTYTIKSAKNIMRTQLCAHSTTIGKKNIDRV